MVRVAHSLAQDGTFADAYGKGMGPTAHAAPAYALLLSVVFRMFGTGQAGDLAQEVFSCMLASLSYSLLPLVARGCSLPLPVGVFAGLLGGLLPINRWVQTKGNFEYALSALLLMAFSLAVLRTWRTKAFSVRAGVEIGVVAGVSLLTAPHAAALIVAVWVAGYFVALRTVAFAKYAAFATAQAAVVVLFLMPWMLRNQRALGSPIWGRSNPGMELNLSNNDRASARWEINSDNGLFLDMHPYETDKEWQRIREVGEVAYNREKLAVALNWISRHPGRFSILTIERAGLFWFPGMKRPPQTAALALVTIAGVIGFALFARSWTPAVWYFTVLWVAYPAPTYAFQMSSRPRYPIEWSIFLFAGYLLYRMSRLRRDAPA